MMKYVDMMRDQSKLIHTYHTVITQGFIYLMILFMVITAEKMRLWLLFLVFLQDGTAAEGQSKTKQESAWLFRLWYTFDHKYPFCVLPYRNKESVCVICF